MRGGLAEDGREVFFVFALDHLLGIASQPFHQSTPMIGQSTPTIWTVFGEYYFGGVVNNENIGKTGDHLENRRNELHPDDPIAQAKNSSK